MSMNVTLSCGARRAAAELGVTEVDVKRARARSTSTSPAPMYLVVFGELPDGRSVRMSCRHDMPGHIVSLNEA